MQDFYDQLFEGSSKGFIICTIKEGVPNSVIEISTLNQQAKALLNWPEQVVTPAPIEQLVPSAPLMQSIKEVYKSGKKQSGLFATSGNSQNKAGLEEELVSYEVNSYGDSLVVKLEKHEPAVEQQSTIAWAIEEHLKTTNLTCIVFFEAVRDADGKVENLRLTYQNQAAIENRALGASTQLGWLITDWYPSTKTTGHFSKYVKVIETGVPFVAEQYYPQYDQSFHVAVSKFGDGIVMSYYNTTEKQNAIRRTQQQAQLLQQIMDSSHDFIMLWEPIRNESGVVVDFKAIQYNQAVIDSGLFTEADFEKFTLTQLLPEAVYFLPEYSRVIEEGTSFRAEQPVKKGDLKRWIDLSVTRLNDGALSIFKDITERKKASMRMQAQNKLLENILNSSDNAILVAESVFDEAGAIVDFVITKANQIAQKYLIQIFGFDVIGTSIMKMTGGKVELFESFVKVAETGEPMILQQRYYPPVDKWFKVSAHKLEKGIVINYVDVTAIHNSLIQAQRQTEMVEGVLNGSINGLFAMEPVYNDEGDVEDFRILLANVGATQITGIPQDALNGQSFLSLFPSVKETGLLDTYQDAFKSNGTSRTEISFPSGEDKNKVWLDISITSVSEKMVILSFMNITERVQLRQEQENLLEELRHSNLYLEQFAYVASHDLQEPARKIQSFGEILVRQYGPLLPQPGVDLIDRMRSAGSRMQDLIEGLLSYSRFSSQKEAYKKVSLDQVLQTVLQDLEGAIEAKKAIIHLGRLPVIKGNAVQMRQLFQNLLSNALKFSRENILPEIHIEGGMATKAEIAATGVDTKKKWYAIRVKDNGIGFDDTYRERVFELFVRLHGRSQYVGSGLGLAISKKVVELHGGGITVTSSPGEGATFIVVLPVRE